MESISTAVLIAAFQPDRSLLGLVTALMWCGVPELVVVDDGSGPLCEETFGTLAGIPGVTVLRHAIRLGDGAALKTGINYLLCAGMKSAGVITVEGAGWEPEAILEVAGRFGLTPDSMVLGPMGLRAIPRTALAGLLRGAEPKPVRQGTGKNCFLDGILNREGLSLLEHDLRGSDDVMLLQGDALAIPDSYGQPDVVFSIGLTEPFDWEAVAAHFGPVRPGGCAIVAFPTPTRLYSIFRRIAATCGLGRLTGKCPPGREEVLAAVRGLGEIVFEKTLLPLIFRHHLVVVRKV